MQMGSLSRSLRKLLCETRAEGDRTEPALALLSPLGLGLVEQTAVEKVQGISRLEQLCEEFSEEERVRELKQEKKRQKRKNRRKNKCACEIPAPLQVPEEDEMIQEKVRSGLRFVRLFLSTLGDTFAKTALNDEFCMIGGGGGGMSKKFPPAGILPQSWTNLKNSCGI